MTAYTVKKGDTLWSIAKKTLGDGNRYKELMKANNLQDTIIYPDMVLKIPSNTSAKDNYSEIGKALEKALNDVDKLSSVQKLYDLIGD